MDYGDINSGGFGGDESPPREQPRALPADLPKSLDDRRRMPTDYVQETEMYDGWQGTSGLQTRAGARAFDSSATSRYCLCPYMIGECLTDSCPCRTITVPD